MTEEEKEEERIARTGKKMDEELKAYLDARFSEVRAEFSEVRAEIEASETRLLTEFWKWGRSSDQRVRRVEQSDATTIERLAAIEERVFTLERRAQGGKKEHR